MLMRYGVQEMSRISAPDNCTPATADLLQAVSDASDPSRVSADADLLAVAIKSFNRIQQAIYDATATINTYIQHVVNLPIPDDDVDGTPLPHICASITRFYLYYDQAPVAVKFAYDEAMQRCKDIAQGIIVLQNKDIPAWKDKIKFESAFHDGRHVHKTSYYRMERALW